MSPDENRVLLRLSESVGELRGDVRGLTQQIARSMEVGAQTARIVERLTGTCIQRGDEHDNYNETLERHGHQIGAQAERLTAVEMRLGVSEGTRTALSSWGRETALLALKTGLVSVALVGAARGAMALVTWLGG